MSSIFYLSRDELHFIQIAEFPILECNNSNDKLTYCKYFYTNRSFVLLCA